MSGPNEDAPPILPRLGAITETDPTAVLLAQMAIVMDQAMAQAIRNYRRGQGKDLRALGFTETADLLGM